MFEFRMNSYSHLPLPSIFGPREFLRCRGPYKGPRGKCFVCLRHHENSAGPFPHQKYKSYEFLPEMFLPEEPLSHWIHMWILTNPKIAIVLKVWILILKTGNHRLFYFHYCLDIGIEEANEKSRLP